MEYLVPVIIALTTSVFGPILVEWVKKKIIDKKNMDPLKDAIIYNEVIEQQLDAMLQELECDQIYIAQFHNGGHFYPTGKSIQKFSVFYEVNTPDVTPLKNTYQNIPTSLFSKALAGLYENGEIHIEDMSEGNNYNLESFCQDNMAKSVYIFTITDLDDRIIGVMGINFIHKKHKFVRDEWIFIRQKMGAIGNLMSNYLKQK
jgi:hypothetical protein